MQVDRHWLKLAESLKQSPRFHSVYITGECNAGKTTLCRYLVEELSQLSVGYLDCDPGQSRIGPPATLGLEVLSRRGESHRGEYLRFVGTTSPASNVLQNLTSIKRLQEKALECKVQRLIIDSSGFIQGPLAREYQYEVIDLIRPNIVVVLMKEGAVDPLFRNFMGTPQIEMLRFPVSDLAVSRTPAARKAYRRECFSQYFNGAQSRELSFKHIGIHGKIPHLRTPEAWKNLLVCLCDRENFAIRLGIIEHIDLNSKKLRILAPAFEPNTVCSVELGTLYLSQTGEELPSPNLS